MQTILLISPFLSHEIDYQGRNGAPILPQIQLVVLRGFGF
jgi:hypothetical protein